jgi:N-acetylmuramoyl-L-alanine amidase
VLSLRLDDYAGRDGAGETTATAVSVLGGGTRLIEVLPWDRAQFGFTRQSRAVADILRAQLQSAGVPLLAGAAVEVPLRPLVGVSMPAVMVDLGMPSNSADERAMNSAEYRGRFIDAIMNTLSRIRQGVPVPAEGR